MNVSHRANKYGKLIVFQTLWIGKYLRFVVDQSPQRLAAERAREIVERNRSARAAAARLRKRLAEALEEAEALGLVTDENEEGEEVLDRRGVLLVLLFVVLALAAAVAVACSWRWWWVVVSGEVTRNLLDFPPGKPAVLNRFLQVKAVQNGGGGGGEISVQDEVEEERN